MLLNNFLNTLEKINRKKHFKPHKYILLLAVIDLINNQKKPVNKIYYDQVLLEIFSKYFNIYSKKGDSNRPFTPFFHLKNDGFWYLKPKPGRESILCEMVTVGGPGDIISNIEYAFLDEIVFELFTNRKSALEIRNKIIHALESFMVNSNNNIAKTGIFENTNEYKTELDNSLFQHERIAIKKMRKSLDSTAMLLSNITIYDSQSRNYYEYDLIVIAPSGLFVVELKHWTGHIRIEPYNWRIDSTRHRVDPHKNNGFKCKILKGIYQHKFVTYPPIWVESIVVLTNSEAVVEGADDPAKKALRKKHNFTFASIPEFVSFLKKREKEGQALVKDQVEAIADYIKSIDMPKRQIQYAVPGYETVAYLSQKPESIELLALPVDIKAKGLHRLRIFRPPLYGAAEEKERFLKKAYNTLNAVQQIGDYPHLHKVMVYKNDEGDIIEVSDWSETGTLQDLIHHYKKTGGFPQEEGLEICRKVALALHKAHQNNIIHRGVKPENILMKNGVPKLMNFDLSFQLEDNHLTVIPDTDKIRDDGHVAPEVLLGGDIDEGTDFYSLGTIAYQIITGEKPFKSTREYVSSGGTLPAEKRKRLTSTGIPDSTIKVIENMLVVKREKRLRDIELILSAFAANKERDKDEEASAVNSRLQPGDIYDVYEIIEFVGEGAETQVYKAKAPRNQIVALKVFHYDISIERVYKELDVATEIHSSYVVRCEQKPGHWQGERYFIVMDYIPGPTLRNLIEDKQKPDRETFMGVARSLMEAIRAFHKHKGEKGEEKPIVHGDIKPDNIMIASKKKPVVIDLGLAGEPRIDVFKGTNGYIPPDTIKGTDRDFSLRGDLFALGVTLWEWLFGSKPYSKPVVGGIPKIPEDLSEYKDLYPWLIKAVATDPGEGFTTIKQMWDEFVRPEKVQGPLEEAEATPAPGKEVKVVKKAPEEHTKSYNPFTTYLNSLSCASAGNENAIAECQVRNEYFSRIHVRNPLTDEIYQQLIDKGMNVILTGNAGDGKTTIAVEVLQKIMGQELQFIGMREEVREHNVVVIKDMSELPVEERPRVLQEAFSEETDKAFLIVSNTGTLLDSFQKAGMEGKRNISESRLLEALKANEPMVFGDRFYLLNIGRMDSIDTACEVFKRMLASENWSICPHCDYRNECPILTNVRLSQSNLELICERVYLVYKRLYEYGQRLTMRQMTGHLAYALTGGWNCNDIAGSSLLARRQLKCDSLFFNLFFGDDGRQVIPEAMNLMPVKVVQEAEFGSVLVPYFERKAWLKEEAPNLYNGQAREVYKFMLEYHSPQAVEKADLRRQMRRLAYFFGRFEKDKQREFISLFLDSPMLLDYLRFTQGSECLPNNLNYRFRMQVLHVLQEYFTGLRLPGDFSKEREIYITLKPPGRKAVTQMVLARLQKKNFKLLVKPRFQYKEDTYCTQIFALIYKENGDQVELELDLPFFDYVARRYEGEIAQELSAYYSNRLEDFKGKLLYSENLQEEEKGNLRLLRICPERKFEELTFLITEKGLEVI